MTARRGSPLFYWLAVALVWLALPAGGGEAGASQPTGPLVVHTSDGAVQGVANGRVRQFSGIPYAAPPVGTLRWQAPQPPAHWTGTLDATKPGPECPQVLAVPGPRGERVHGNENCLTINVTAPAAEPHRQLPVMVWIYGGTFVSGAGASNPLAHLVSHGVIGVTFNYRLGVLGFLASTALRSPDGSIGNYGVLDQQAALRWVQENISAFGGNPHDVTIFGQSAGGISVCAQVLSPGAHGLFERAISESGPCGGPQFLPLSTSEQRGAQLVAKLGCAAASNVAACLRSLPVSTLVRVLPSTTAVNVLDTSLDPSPTDDGVVLPTEPLTAIEHGQFNHVPMIIGVDRDEGRLFAGLLFNATGHPLTAASYPTEVSQYFGSTYGESVARQVLSRYPLSAYPDPGAAFGEALGDSFLLCPAVRGAGLLSSHTPVYLYEFTHTPDPLAIPTPGITLGAYHGAELPYVFGQSLGTGPPFTHAERGLSADVETAWTRFAASGDPSTKAVPWPRLSGPGGTYLDLEIPPQRATGLKSATCGFWAAAEAPTG